jgi:hypothetical protein
VDLARVTGFTDQLVHVRTIAGTFDFPYLSTYTPRLDETVVIENGVVTGPTVATHAHED